MGNKRADITEAMIARKLSEKFNDKLERNGKDVRWFHDFYKLESECYLSYPETVSQINCVIEMSAHLNRAINRYLEE